MPILYSQRSVPLAATVAGFGASMRLGYDFTGFDSRPLFQAYDHEAGATGTLVTTGAYDQVTYNGLPGIIQNASGATAQFNSAADFGMQIGSGDYTICILTTTPAVLPSGSGSTAAVARFDNNGSGSLHEILITHTVDGWDFAVNGNIGTSIALSKVGANKTVAFFIRRSADVISTWRHTLGDGANIPQRHADFANTTVWNSTNAQRVRVLTGAASGAKTDWPALHSVRLHNVAFTTTEMVNYSEDWWAVDQYTVDSQAPTMSGSIAVVSKTSSTLNLTLPAATDNVAVTGYEYRVDGGAWQNNGNSRSVAISGLTALTSYSIDGRAYDDAGNRSTSVNAVISTYRAGAMGSAILAATGPIDGNQAGILYNDVATNGSDDNKWFSFYIVTPPASGTLDINPNGTFSFIGPSSTTFTYQLEVDGVNVGSPTFVTLYSGEGGGGGTPSATINNLSVAEGVGTANLTVTLSQTSVSTVTIDYATADGTAVAGSDYQATSGTLSFAPGETSKSIPVVIIDDTATEGDETILVNLSNPVNVTLGNTQGIITINANDAVVPSISVNSVTVSESVGVATLTVTLSEASTSVVAVDYATANGTTTAGSDYVAATGTLIFAAGETSKTIQVTVTDDAVTEGAETILVNLANPVSATLATSQGVITISANDTVVISGRLSVKSNGTYSQVGIFTKTNGVYSPATLYVKQGGAYST